MQITLLHGYPDFVGKRSIWCGFGTGPKSYTGGNSGGDTIAGMPFQFYIDGVNDTVSVSGTYTAVAQPSTTGPRPTWKLRYFLTVGATEVTNATDLSAEKFQLTGFGGLY